MKRCLRDDGIILIKTMNGGNAILDAVTLYSDLTYKIMFDEFSLKEVAILSGFDKDKVKIRNSNLYVFFCNPLNYVAWGINGLISIIIRLYFILINKRNKVFSKNIIAVLRKWKIIIEVKCAVLEKDKSYREYIYENYADSLQNNLITGNMVKERKYVLKYFKKNYLPYFPKDKNSRVLDLGCGLGNYLLAAKAYGYMNVVGVDASKSVVELNKKEGIDCYCADAVNYLKEHENEYDVILFNDIIEHFTKDELFGVLLALKASLKNGGILFIKTYNSSNPITGIGGRYFDITHEIGFTEISMRQILKAVSFQKIKIIGADIYVMPLGNLLKILGKLINIVWYLLNCLYGRTTIKIFEKNIIAIVQKEKL